MNLTQSPFTQLTDQPSPSKMNGKEVFYRDAKTVLTFGPTFQDKRLCDGITLNAGDACGYSCAYCYVPPQMRKILNDYRNNILKNTPHVEAVVRRRNATLLLIQQLLNSKDRPKYLNAGDNRVVYTSTLVDVAANTTLMLETAEMINIIFKLTNWQVRLLTKSNLFPKMVEKIDEKYHQRLILGVSTGTFCDKVAKAIEQGTAPVSKRLESLHWLQDRGFRTFGMICPSLPQENYNGFAKEAARAIRVDKCEHVWAEVINVRGSAFENTCTALNEAGLVSEEAALRTVMGDTDSWEDYAKATFEAHALNIPPSKLRFLQYVNPKTLDYWRPLEPRGAVLLGNCAHTGTQ